MGCANRTNTWQQQQQQVVGKPLIPNWVPRMGRIGFVAPVSGSLAWNFLPRLALLNADDSRGNDSRWIFRLIWTQQQWTRSSMKMGRSVRRLFSSKLKISRSIFFGLFLLQGLLWTRSCLSSILWWVEGGNSLQLRSIQTRWILHIIYLFSKQM